MKDDNPQSDRAVWLAEWFDRAIPVAFVGALVAAGLLVLAGWYDLVFAAWSAVLWIASFATCVLLHRRFLANRSLPPPVNLYNPALENPVFQLILHLFLIALAMGSFLIALASGSIIFWTTSMVALPLVHLMAIVGGRITIGRVASPRILPITKREVLWAGLVVLLPVAFLPIALQLFYPPPLAVLGVLSWPLVLAWLFGVQLVDLGKAPRRKENVADPR